MASWPLTTPHNWWIDYRTFTPIHPTPVDLSYFECMDKASEFLHKYITALIMRRSLTLFMDISIQ
jgi:hypothetical protein